MYMHGHPDVQRAIPVEHIFQKNADMLQLLALYIVNNVLLEQEND